MDQCSRCRFWLNWDSEGTGLGECHRFPPRMELVHRVDGAEELVATVRPEDGGWALTAPDDWCGEFQHIPTRSAPTAEAGPAASQGPVDAGPAI